MNTSAIALIGYVGWTWALLVFLLLYRTASTLGGRAANSFAPDGSGVPAWVSRLTRAHANCYENLPIFAALVLLALVTGNAAVTDGLALWVLAARVMQSTVHLASIANLAAMVRFSFIAVQVGIEGYWLVELFTALR